MSLEYLISGIITVCSAVVLDIRAAEAGEVLTHSRVWPPGASVSNLKELVPASR